MTATAKSNVMPIAAEMPGDDYFGPGNDEDGDVLPLERETHEHSDIRLGERFVELCGDRLRYVGKFESFYLWDGRRWALDECRGAEELAKDAARIILAEAKAAWLYANEKFGDDAKRKPETDDEKRSNAAAKKKIADAEATYKWAIRSQEVRRLGAMLQLARSDPRISISYLLLDVDPWLFNVENGTIELKTCTLRAHSPGDLITKLAPVEYHPDAECPQFDAALLAWMKNDQPLVTFLLRFFGYCLTGIVIEHVMLFWYGLGGNGKGVLGNLLMRLFGDYACKAAPDLLFTTEKTDRHPVELADLYKLRLVFCNETKRARVWDEAKIKDITGGDRMKARKMRENFWPFEPTHKIVVWGNHKPRFSGPPDDGMKRRLRLTPFDAKFEKHEIDRNLGEKLWTEREGILALIVRGCAEYQREGLPAPNRVEDTTQVYLDSENSAGLYLDAWCVIEPEKDTAPIARKVLYMAYESWCAEQSEKPVHPKAFAEVLRARGVTDGKVRTDEGPRDGWKGVRFKSATEQDDGGKE